MKNIKSDYAEEAPIAGLEPFLMEFLHNRERDFILLKNFYKEENLPEIRKIFHSWVGFCEPYGFHFLAAVASEFQESSMTKGMLNFDVYLKEIENYLKIKKQLLNRESPS